MTAKIVVGVDLGSTSARAAALDRVGRVHANSRVPYEDASTWPHGRADAPAILRAFEQALDALALPDPPAALAVGGQSPTTVPAADTFAVTCTHPAGATLGPVEQHIEQHAFLQSEIGEDTAPAQLWDWALQQLGAPPHQGRWPGDPPLPGYGPVVATGTAAGIANGSHHVATGTQLVPGAQDAYLAFWAAGIDTPGRALDPGGRTGGFGVAVSPGNRPLDMFALPSAARDVDIVGGPVSAHGLMLEWWSAMTGRLVPELLALAEQVPPGAGGVLALPYLEGERAPRWDRDLRAELVGLSATTGPGEVMRALLEASAYGITHIARELAACGVTTEVLVVGGSPARSRLWCEIKASVLGVPAEVPAFPELAAYGAALAAGAAAGWWPAPGDGRAGDWPRPEVTLIEPVARPEYRDAYERFVALGDAAIARLARQRSEQRCRTP